ncbi:D-alanyl-D-alanine carboxypeptidase [Rhodoblastus acidophilus]|uniref:D-alanyl-D-alanine carboxypeptidase n=1 Tax=Candidatus Rhodoblastus alkanivorans TaxID=2954117 RepID=A0ABS9Z6P0_9HYPH|nr:D-alanyl-D-alanine carboxypeptidase family protein [Candidatus Rhodoblastus alkanivorans]MCI4680287.1 D-alanyl-D-alanine carboxypeptidase [Candidatus Rhodoblastus alkanivorans]MCI4683106.1 D-alanyl-D-alanine carboxypeptidase [Candidatus Rhodoblastus alkanivorans]MDI4640417.1 D-alanyl-D-alanine carboxypeptidase [Rhodoblastus acidophilus]
MFKRNIRDRFLAKAAISALVAALIGGAFTTPAQARRHHHHHRHAHHQSAVHRGHGHAHFAAHRRHHGATAPISTNAAIVVDGATGRVIWGIDENAPRHPASITKVMTLYLLFEQMEKGHVTPNDQIPISAHAAAQAPTKLGLRPGSTIRVSDAIKAIVTRSANDIAVAVAEYVGGSENHFAEEMTAKAHALGMAHTYYVNASGLPNNAQLTTAYDLAILGRAIQSRFPEYYHFFSLREFDYHGQHIRNHNHLMDRVAGMDGIKTGYTAASGFNLLSSVKHDGHSIVAVVMGGRSARSRDNYMAALINRYLDKGGSPRAESRVAEHEEPARREEAAAPAAPVDSNPRPRPAFVSAPAANLHENSDGRLYTASIPHRHAEARAATTAEAASAPTPVSRWIVGPPGINLRAATRFRSEDDGVQSRTSTREARREAQAAAKVQAAAKAERAAKAEDEANDAPAPKPLPGKPPASGWMIQIGATDDADKAAALLDKAKAKRHTLLASAKPFTEKVQKGHGTIYRARFAGLEEDEAQAACKALKNSGFHCFAIRN